MPRFLRHAIVSLRDLLASAGPLLALGIVLVALAYWALDPMPPRHVVMATGPERSAYDSFGERYRTVLARRGIELELRPTAGSLANLEALGQAGGDVAFGFVQGGTRDPGAASREGLASIGSLFYEPVWVFYRQAVLGERLESLRGLKGRRVSVGTEGSGVPRLIERLLDANGLGDASVIERLHLDHTPAVVELIEGRIDAVVFASAPESQLVQMLLMTPGIGLLDFTRAPAYERRYPFLSAVTLPRGIVSLAADLPTRDQSLVATTTTLVARAGTHPALLQLMVQAAAEIHGQPGWFNRNRQFPSPDYSEIPVAAEAQRFYRNGSPLLQRYLPFAMANLIDRMWVVLAAIVAVLIPLSRLVPPLYEFRVRSRIFRWYAQLREIETRIDRPPAGGLGELLDELNTLDRRVEGISVPLSHADELYALRSHIRLVRARLEERR